MNKATKAIISKLLFFAVYVAVIFFSYSSITRQQSLFVVSFLFGYILFTANVAKQNRNVIVQNFKSFSLFFVLAIIPITLLVLFQKTIYNYVQNYYIASFLAIFGIGSLCGFIAKNKIYR